MGEVTITAEPLAGARCMFRVSRPVAENQWAYIPNHSSAERSPLAQALFELDGISSLLIAHDLIVATRAGNPGWPLVGPSVRMVRRILVGEASQAIVDWKSLGRNLGKVVRAHLESGQPALHSTLVDSMPAPSVLRSRVQEVLTERVNPVVASHGGGVELVDLIENVVYLRMSGGCQGCGLADVTLRHGVDAAIREAVPEIGLIHDLTNHEAGESPYASAGFSPFKSGR